MFPKFGRVGKLSSHVHIWETYLYIIVRRFPTQVWTLLNIFRTPFSDRLCWFSEVFDCWQFGTSCLVGIFLYSCHCEYGFQCEIQHQSFCLCRILYRYSRIQIVKISTYLICEYVYYVCILSGTTFPMYCLLRCVSRKSEKLFYRVSTTFRLLRNWSFVVQ